jgi:hypothetical protein
VIGFTGTHHVADAQQEHPEAIDLADRPASVHDPLAGGSGGAVADRVAIAASCPTRRLALRLLDEDGAKRERKQRAVAAATGATLGLVAGPAAGIVGAAAGVLVEPLVASVREKLGADGRCRATEVLEHAADVADRSPREVADMIRATERTRLLGGIAMSAATRTA